MLGLQNLSEYQTFELAKIFLDKLLLGAAILIASNFLARSLERLKQMISFSEKIGVIRAEKNGEVWEAANRLMFASESAVRRAAEIMSETSEEGLKEVLARELAPIEAETQKMSQELKEIAQINRYWIGEELYFRFRDFHNLAGEYKIAFAEHDLE